MVEMILSAFASVIFFIEKEDKHCNENLWLDWFGKVIEIG